MRYQQFLAFIIISVLSFTSQADHVKINNAYIPEGPPVSRVFAAFMEIENRSNDTIYITEVSSEDFGAIEMHLTKDINGIARMVPQVQLIIPANSTLVLKPGSYHLMLFRPQKSLRKGDTSTIVFTFGNGESFSKVVTVK